MPDPYFVGIHFLISPVRLDGFVTLNKLVDKRLGLGHVPRSDCGDLMNDIAHGAPSHDRELEVDIGRRDPNLRPWVYQNVLHRYRSTIENRHVE